MKSAKDKLVTQLEKQKVDLGVKIAAIKSHGSKINQAGDDLREAQTTKLAENQKATIEAKALAEQQTEKQLAKQDIFYDLILFLLVPLHLYAIYEFVHVLNHKSALLILLIFLFH